MIPFVRAADDPPAIRYRRMILQDIPVLVVLAMMDIDDEIDNEDTDCVRFVFIGGGDRRRPGMWIRTGPNEMTFREQINPTSIRFWEPIPARETTFNEEGLVVQEIIRGPVDDNTKRVSEDGIAFGYRQSRNSEENGDWGLHPGYDTPYFVCERRFSNYPNLVLRGTNEAYDELKRQIKAGPDCHSLPLYLGAKLARDPLNPNADKWMVRPGWDTDGFRCERCYSEFPDEVMFGTNNVYDELERKIRGIPGDYSESPRFEEDENDGDEGGDEEENEGDNDACEDMGDKDDDNDDDYGEGSYDVKKCSI